MNDQLRDYIENQRNQGVSDEAIGITLIEQGGWNKEDITAVFQEINNLSTQIQKPQPPSSDLAFYAENQKTPNNILKLLTHPVSILVETALLIVIAILVSPPAIDVFILLFSPLIIGVVFVFLVARWVIKDCRKFKESGVKTLNPGMWGIAVFFLLFPFFPIYLTVRHFKYKKLLQDSTATTNNKVIYFIVALLVLISLVASIQNAYKEAQFRNEVQRELLNSIQEENPNRAEDQAFESTRENTDQFAEDDLKDTQSKNTDVALINVSDMEVATPVQDLLVLIPNSQMSKDSTHVYSNPKTIPGGGGWGWRIIEEADPDNLEMVIGSRVFVSGGNIYSDVGHLLPIHADNLRVYGNGFIGDKDYVFAFSNTGYSYWDIKKVEGVDVESFTYIGGRYAMDNDKVYYENKELIGADPDLESRTVEIPSEEIIPPNEELYDIPVVYLINGISLYYKETRFEINGNSIDHLGKGWITDGESIWKFTFHPAFADYVDVSLSKPPFGSGENQSDYIDISSFRVDEVTGDVFDKNGKLTPYIKG